TLYQNEDPAAQLSNATGQHLYAGQTGSVRVPAGQRIRRALIKFDLSSVPSGSTINSATLKLNMSMTVSGAQTIELHRAQKDWGEGTSNAAGGAHPAEGDGATATTGDATWLFNFFNTQSWTLHGGDFVGTASAST